MAEFSVSELVKDIERSFGNLKLPMLGDCCIYRVPHNLPKVMNEDAYSTHAVSVGPLHHGRKELEPMEKQKLRYLQEFIDHTYSSLHDLVCFAKNMEDRIRNCYAETILYNSHEFVKMILTDAAFIILHIVKSNYDDLDEVVYRNSCLMSSIRRDIMLLENQIPFFVLTELYDLYKQKLDGTAFPRLEHTGLSSFSKLTCDFFKGFEYRNKIINEEIREDVKHFTDLLRFFHLPSHLTPRRTEEENKLLYNASELCEAGVNIRVSSGGRLLDCRYRDAVLHIPPLELNELTTCLLQNLMVLELCHYPGMTYICDYMSLMGYLMETSKDVDHLVQKKILYNGLGDTNEVITFVKKLGTHLAVDRYHNHYDELFRGINGHCEQRWLKFKYHEHIWQKWLAILKVEYFNTPWRIASTAAAIILLVLTFIQTVFAIIK